MNRIVTTLSSDLRSSGIGVQASNSGLNDVAKVLDTLALTLDHHGVTSQRLGYT